MIITHLLAAFRRWIQYRDTVRELSELTDRELNDLGIARYDIKALARRATA